MAHAQMLERLEILSPAETTAVREALQTLLQRHAARTITINPADEDCHTVIEKMLTGLIGDTGKKIHTGRSRNDQVIVTLRLFARERLLAYAHQVSALIGALLERAAEGYGVPIPGYTHMRQAMPSSFGHLFSAYAESLIHNLGLIAQALRFANRSPLGSASGYGVPLALDRHYVSDLLAFAGPDRNALYIQNTRGKTESIALHAVLQVQMDLSRLAHDLILFSMEHFGFLAIPEAYTTGSSIMPQKRNPDALELIRGQLSAVQSRFNEAVSTIAHLPAGYQRDLQLTKESFMTGLQRGSDSVVVMEKICQGLRLQPEACVAGFAPDIFATDEALRLVRAGLSFREAYLQAAQQAADQPRPDQDALLALLQQRQHLGSPADADLTGLHALWQEQMAAFAPYAQAIQQAWQLLPTA